MWKRKIYNFRTCSRRQNFLSLDHPKTYKYMRRQWILIGQSILKTIRTIGDKKCPSRGGRNRTRTCAKSRPVTAGTVINGLNKADFFVGRSLLLFYASVLYSLSLLPLLFGKTCVYIILLLSPKQISKNLPKFIRLSYSYRCRFDKTR